VPTAAAWKATQISASANAKTKPKPKPKPKAEPSTSTETDNDTDTGTDSHIDAARGAGTSADTDQTMGDSPTMKPQEAGQFNPSPDNWLEHGRQTPNLMERRECATPQ
jgi:hypothetical protein